MEEICDMIKSDWKLLCSDNDQLRIEVEEANGKIQQLNA